MNQRMLIKLALATAYQLVAGFGVAWRGDFVRTTEQAAVSFAEMHSKHVDDLIVSCQQFSESKNSD